MEGEGTAAATRIGKVVAVVFTGWPPPYDVSSAVISDMRLRSTFQLSLEALFLETQ